MHSGRQIAAARTLIGMSQDELAQKIKVSRSTIQRIEADSEKASHLSYILAIKSIFHDIGIDLHKNGSVTLGKPLNEM